MSERFTMFKPMRATRTMIAVALLWAPAAWGQADTYHTPLDPSRGGGLVGTIQGAPGDLQRVLAVEPFELKAYAANLNRSTGRFEFRGLPPGEYDLVIKSVGHVHEGLTLETDPTVEPDTAALKEMVEGFGETLYPSERYFDVKHIVRLTGDGEEARGFVVFTRTRPGLLSNGTPFNGHIRRLALVDMVKTRDVWQIRVVRHLFRQQVPPDSDDIEVSYTYSPDLGGFLVGESVHDAGTINLRQLERVPSSRYGSARDQEFWDD